MLCTVLIVIPMGRILDIYTSLGTKEMYSGLLRELANVTERVLFYYLGKVMVIGSLLEERKFHTCCLEGKEEGSYRLVTCHPLFRHWEDYGAKSWKPFPGI